MNKLQNVNLSVLGLIAGLIAGIFFAIIHGVMISNIWFSLPMLLIAGGLCGLCLGWTYDLLFDKPTLGSWLRFNGWFVSLFGILSIFSEIAFEPVISIGEVLQGGPPGDVYLQALPVTIFSTLVMAGLIFWRYGKTLKHFGAILLTCSVLVILLGLNISLMGLVYVPTNSYYLFAETFGLVLSLNIVFVVAFLILSRKHFVN